MGVLKIAEQWRHQKDTDLQITTQKTEDRGTMTTPKRHRSTNHYTENRRSSYTNPTKNGSDSGALEG